MRSKTLFGFISLQKKEIGPEDAEYAFPEVVLNFIRKVVPGDVKGEIREVCLPQQTQNFLIFILVFLSNKIDLGVGVMLVSKLYTMVNFLYIYTFSQEAFKVTLQEFCTAIDLCVLDPITVDKVEGRCSSSS